MPPTTCTGYPVVLALEKMANYGYGVSRIHVSMQTTAKSPIIIPFPGAWLLIYLAISCFSDHHHLNLFWIYRVICENGDEGAPWRREAGCSCSLHCSLALYKLIPAFPFIVLFTTDLMFLWSHCNHSRMHHCFCDNAPSAQILMRHIASAGSHSSPSTSRHPQSHNPQQLELSIPGQRGAGSCS